MGEQVIGIWNYCDDYEFVTLEQLKQHIERDRCGWNIHQYLDKRVNTNLTRFNYDPYTGKKIDWKQLRLKV